MIVINLVRILITISPVLCSLQGLVKVSVVVETSMMLQVILAIFLSAILLAALIIEFKRLRVSARLKHIPTAKEFPFIGTRFILSMFDMAEFLRYFKEMYTAPIGKIFIGHKVAFVISDPETLREIANSNVCLERPLHFRFWPYWRSIMTNRCKLLSYHYFNLL